MYSLNKKVVTPLPLFNFDDNNPVPRLIDQTLSGDVYKNSAGFIESDITALHKAQTQSQIDAILNRLQDIPVSPGTDLSDREILDNLAPTFLRDSTDYLRLTEQIAIKSVNEQIAKADEQIQMPSEPSVVDTKSVNE